MNDYKIKSIFSVPIYRAYRDSDLDSTEEKEVEDIIKEGIYIRRRYGLGSLTPSNNTYIFDGKLKNIKQFCEKHIDNYVKDIIATKEELNFYITQSWLNIIKPGESLQNHSHSNSIISGVFYISTEEDDQIMFTDPNVKLKEYIRFEGEFNLWNTSTWTYPSKNNSLILFPAWIDHSILQNLNATRDRISISFNTYAKGRFGAAFNRNELILS